MVAIKVTKGTMIDMINGIINEVKYTKLESLIP